MKTPPPPHAKGQKSLQKRQTASRAAATNHETSIDKRTKVLLLCVIVGSFGTSVMLGSFDIVEAGQVVIAVEPSGRVVGPVDAGWHFAWCNPFSEKFNFTVTVQTVTITGMYADTLDGNVNLDITVNYILPREYVIAVFETYGPEYKGAIEAVITSAFRDVVASQTMRAVALENRSAVQELCRQTIVTGLDRYYVEFLALRVQNILLPTAFSQAQIQTQVAYEQLRAANITRQIQILNATTAAEVEIINAESLANTTVIEAESTAQAIALAIDALNVTGNFTENQLLTYLYIQALSDYSQWGDVLLITDGTTPVLINITPNATSPNAPRRW